MSSTSTTVPTCNFPPSGRQTSGPKRPLSIRVDLQHVKELQNLLEKEDGTEVLGTVIRAAWTLLLRCYTGLNEVCFGFEEVGVLRHATKAENANSSDPSHRVALIGVDESASVDEFIQKAQGKNCFCDATSSSSYEYNTSILIRYGSSTASLPKTQLPSRSSAVMSDKCNIRLLVKSLKTGLSVFLEYRNSYIPTEHAKNVASTIDRIFANVLLSPGTIVEKLDYLGHRNRRQIEKWNDRPLEKVDKTIHEIIEENVRSQPLQEAICAWDGSLTYSELNEHARRIAARLIELGVGPEVFVPLCFDKSKWNIVSMLAVWKAGGACKSKIRSWQRSDIR